ncbi:MAG: beta strand repeat-containing protein [Planctomycetota bacterium]
MQGGNATTSNGNLTVNGDLTLDAAGIGGDQTLTAGSGALDLNGHVTKTTLGQITMNGPGGIMLGGNVSTAFGGIVLNDEVTLDAAGIGSDQAINANGGILDFNGNVTKTTGGAMTLAGTGGVFLAGNAIANVGNLVISNDVTLDAAGGAGQTIMTNGGLIDLNGNVTKLTSGDLVINAGSGAVDVEGDIQVTGFASNLTVSGGGGISLFGNAATVFGTLRFDDDLTLDGADQSLLSAGVIDLNGNVTKTTAGALAINAAGGFVDAEGDITHTVNGFANTVTLSGDLGVHLAGSVTTNNARLHITDALVLDGANQTLATNNGLLSLDSVVTKTTSGTLTLNTGLGQIDANGPITHQGVANFDNLTLMSTLGSANAILLGGDVTTNGGNLSILGNAQFDGTGLASNQRLDAGNGVLNVSGTLQKTTAGNLTLGGATNISLGDHVTVDMGDLTIEDAFMAFGNLTALNNISLLGNGQFSGGALQITATNGTLTTQDLTGFALGLSLSLTGGAGITLNGDISVPGSVVVNNAFTSSGNIFAAFGNITLAGPGVLTGANQTIGSAFGTTQVLQPLAQLTPGGLLFLGQGATGNVDLNANVASAGQLVILDQFTSSGDLFGSFGVTLEGNGVLDGVGVNQRIDAGAGALVANGTLTKTGAGNLNLAGDAGVTLSGAVAVNDGGLTVEDAVALGADVTTTGGQAYQAALTLANDAVLTDSGAAGIVFGSTVDGPFALTVNTASDVTFVGDVGGITSLASLSTGVQGFLLFQGNLVRTTGNVSLNESITIPVPATATIGASGNILFSAGGNFAMGQNQKLSVLGSGTIVTNTARLGDINTLGDLIVTASAIQLLGRPAGPVTGESLPDRGLDFVAGGRFFFSSIPVVVGGGVAQFANPLADGDALGTLRGYIMRAFGPVTSEMILPTTGANAGTYLDLRAKGPSNTNIGEVFATVIPPDTQQADVNQHVPLPSSIRDILAQSMNVPARVLGPQELAELVVGRAVYLDAPPETSVDARVINQRIAENRVLTEAATNVVDAYNLLTAGDRGIDQVRFDCGVAWRIYRRTVGEGSATPDGFIAFCQSEPGYEQVMADLTAMSTLLENMQVLGLTDAELQLPVDTVLGLFASPDLPARTLESILNAMNAEETAMNLP